MIEISYFLSVFKNPGYVEEGVQTLTEDEKYQMRQNTFVILEKVRP
jgi:hypothetical protein